MWEGGRGLWFSHASRHTWHCIYTKSIMFSMEYIVFSTSAIMSSAKSPAAAPPVTTHQASSVSEPPCLEMIIVPAGDRGLTKALRTRKPSSLKRWISTGESSRGACGSRSAGGVSSYGSLHGAAGSVRGRGRWSSVWQLGTGLAVVKQGDCVTTAHAAQVWAQSAGAPRGSGRAGRPTARRRTSHRPPSAGRSLTS